MMRMLRSIFSAGALAALAGLLLSCNNQPTEQGMLGSSQPPETAFAPTPPEGSRNNAFKLRLEWHGNDADGIVQGYEYRVEGPLFDNTWQFTKSFYVNFKFRDGWYTVEVRAVDNTGTMDPTPARLRFHVAGPTFDHGILLLDDDPNGSLEQASDAFYDSLMIAAGYRNYTFWDYQDRFATRKPPFVTTPSDTDATGAPNLGLGAFSTIIWCTSAAGNLGLNERLVQDYFDMGGNLWVAGTDPLQSLSGNSPIGLDLAPNSTGYKYFHVLRAKAADLNIDWLLGTDNRFPDLATSYQVPRTTIFQYLAARVNQLIPQPDAHSIYTFSNNYYRDTRRALEVNSEEFAGTPCAIIYSSSAYKAALFGFPLVAAVRVGSAIVNLVNTRAMAKTVEHILANEFGEPR